MVVDCPIQRMADLVDLAAAVATKEVELEVLATYLQYLRPKEIMVERATADLHSKVVEVAVQGQQGPPVALVPMVVLECKIPIGPASIFITVEVEAPKKEMALGGPGVRAEAVVVLEAMERTASGVGELVVQDQPLVTHRPAQAARAP